MMVDRWLVVSDTCFLFVSHAISLRSMTTAFGFLHYPPPVAKWSLVKLAAMTGPDSSCLCCGCRSISDLTSIPSEDTLFRNLSKAVGRNELTCSSRCANTARVVTKQYLRLLVLWWLCCLLLAMYSYPISFHPSSIF
ncbi:hypothetical protein GQ43DRAFT_214385 [Delitschia confertaspora ATCC 74209]|uniref:Uncharacterized protein n=1 Tax=Delitschia confertaspora ATCC 74209 TaxID=1513339 RepID=A0A9P4JIH4_9PLEO|nr:hypothetical protein GQ43DRAFT_214385 [Delitschia confertaspora ATCC 74209]